ncbi:uncharacterized protein si:dkey-283b1.6 [Lampris incognitus]|uniref:uncharacterized protein si:dkey-283b1.6 n=1 Tax=Lampris incognitus TaxID=2546036 RepID=UPI0024B49CD5|nr:uncharacterized protein si:dkey-283b1.6 [Lampris incognitus]
MDVIPAVEIFLSILGFGFSILLCTVFCRLCQRIREEREELSRSEEGQISPIFFIPYPGSRSMQQGEEHGRLPRLSQEAYRPPRYSTAVYCGAPPSYNELDFKQEDLPPAYSEHASVPIHPIMPPAHTDLVQPQPCSQPEDLTA